MITAPAVAAALVFCTVKLRSAGSPPTPVAVPPDNEPSIVTPSAPFTRMIPTVLLPVIERATPVGLIVTVNPPTISLSATPPFSPARSETILMTILPVAPVALRLSKIPPGFVSDGKLPPEPTVYVPLKGAATVNPLATISFAAFESGVVTAAVVTYGPTVVNAGTAANVTVTTCSGAIDAMDCALL